ncbi:hypothetical protein LJC11_03180 [Bacteroidales bacterium OttesenSCG-928-I21]|nr:hypothetical protein [Bacteroidales bacterium OttesenSCG-928-I21]
MDNKDCSVVNYVTINSENAIVGSCVSCECESKDNEALKFKGFNVFPMGKAKLSIKNDVLKVDNIGNSGLDGVLIEFDYKENREDNHTVYFGDLSSIEKNKGVFKTTTLMKNPFGQVVTSFETFKWYNESRNRIMVGYNSILLPKEFKLFGNLDGKTVFEIDSKDLIEPEYPIDPGDNPPVGFPWAIVIAAAALAVSIYEAVRTKTTTTRTTNYDSQGKIIGYSTTVTEDPEPFEIEVNEKTFIVNEFGIKYDEEFPSQLIGLPALSSHVVGEMITGYNLSSFEITSIE